MTANSHNNAGRSKSSRRLLPIALVAVALAVTVVAILATSTDPDEDLDLSLDTLGPDGRTAEEAPVEMGEHREILRRELGSLLGHAYISGPCRRF